ncbi:MAG: hypothetical protein Q8P41_10770 [Pseudomonadota bacterium]|nr:hypothetical protein [Pseudomonadota bacterium]
MTDAFLPVDAVAWSVAAGLLGLALWWSRGGASGWDPAAFFGATLAAMFGPGHLPLTGGPVPPEGFEGTPAELEAVDDPRVRLGPLVTWEALAGWTEPAQTAIARRLDGVRLIWFEPPPVHVEGVEAVVLDTVDAALVDRLLTRPDLRIVVAAHAQADAVLRLLHDAPGLRDRLRAVLLVAPTLDAAWLAEHFTHPAFDLELAREVPYLTLRAGPDAAAQQLPPPATPATGRRSIGVVDLGVLPSELLPDPRVGRALAALCAVLG